MTGRRAFSRSPRRGVTATLVVAATSFMGMHDLRADDAPSLASLAAARAEELTTGHDFDDARKVLAAETSDDPLLALERGRLALYEADYDRAVVVLARPDVANTEEGALLLDIARGSARATAAAVVDRDDAAGVEIRYQDEFDRPLTPLVVDTVVRARDALTRDLGVTWPKPTRITVVRDHLGLSVMTGLPYASAQTTGTVAVAKWGRVTILSPRASEHGYVWRDTITHELTHLALSRATVDRAPLWLQEGVAKREEVRWREPGPYDESPPPDAVASKGIELKLDLPLDKLGPSIAMLPSADAAMVAFAEVTSFVKHFANTQGPDALPKLLAALRSGKSTDAALVAVSGADLKAWDARWRTYLLNRAKDPIPAGFALGKGAPEGARELRERSRLGELLLGRNHASAAEFEVDKVKGTLAKEDPSFRHLVARIREAKGEGELADAALGDPREVVSSFGPYWGIRGRLQRSRADHAGADRSFDEAIATDPLDVEVACEGVTDDATPRRAAFAPLCVAARLRAEPPLGRD
ncbi:MAG: peptidase MA family metallohydrolase [Polyangiaceae bacterium]